jgi:beta-glucosidase
VGYRYYDKKKVPVQFPFGYGLSYTTFEYSNARAAEAFDDVDGLSVSVDITNTGNAAGSEVVQVYVRDKDSKLDRPIKELKGFAKVYLEPGETQTVSIKLDFRAFAYYHPKYSAWITEDGEFDILIGASSQDIRQVLTTTMTSSLHLPCILDQESTLREWLDDPRGAAALEPMIGEMKKTFGAFLGGDEGIGMDPLAMILDMPLPSILMWQPELLPMPVEDMVDVFLQQAHSHDA